MTTYFGILTKIGEAKEANAKALGVPVKIAEMEVGDGGGVLPVPDREQKSLIGTKHRAPINRIFVDPSNPAWLVVEQVIPEQFGGWWARELGLRDADGDLIAVSNCPPTYKPQMAEGSARTQVVRMVLQVSSTSNFTLKIDPAVVLATRGYVDAEVATRLGKDDTAKAAAKLATGRKIAIGGPISASGVVFDGTKDINLNTGELAQDSFLVGNGADPIRALNAEQARELLDVQIRQSTMTITQTGEVPLPGEWRGKRARYQIVGGGGGGGNGATGYGNQSAQSPDVSGGGGGGGGAGEYKTGEITLPSTPTISCIVGVGGAGGAAFSGHVGAQGSAGGITSIADLVSANGGRGGGGGGGANIQARTFGGIPGGLGASGGQPGTAEVYGSSGLASNAIPGNGGHGGSTPFGTGGGGGGRSGQRLFAGTAGGAPTPNSGGGGGGGGGANGPTNGSAPGGAGADGKIILELI